MKNVKFFAAFSPLFREKAWQKASTVPVPRTGIAYSEEFSPFPCGEYKWRTAKSFRGTSISALHRIDEKFLPRFFQKARGVWGNAPRPSAFLFLLAFFLCASRNQRKKAAKESCKTIPRRRSRDRMDFDRVKIHSATWSSPAICDARFFEKKPRFFEKKLGKKLPPFPCSTLIDVPRRF